MTNQSHPKVQELKAKQMHNTGTLLRFSVLVPLFMMLNEPGKTYTEIIDSLVITSLIFAFFLIVGNVFMYKAEKKLNLLYNQKYLRNMTAYRRTAQKKRRSTAGKRRRYT
ncbi:MAG: hypothetical protein PF693_12090 [Spirochaetia bacterium]|jgi:hypothetical protein|nr:hypothetical protein [Spirochaetia bacterium]